MSDSIDDDIASMEGDELRASLWYPRADGKCKAVIVELIDTRAAGDIRITYDYEASQWAVQHLLGQDVNSDWIWSEPELIKPKAERSEPWLTRTT